MKPTTIGMWQIIAGAMCWGTLGILGTALERAGFGSTEVASLRICIAFAFLLAALPYFWHGLRRLQWRHPHQASARWSRF